MTKFIQISLTFLVASLLSGLTYANLTSKSLVEDCKIKILAVEKKTKNTLDDAFQTGACAGYLKGLDDMHILFAAVIAKYADNKDIPKYFLYCLPEGSSNTQLAKVIVNYLSKHPDESNDPASVTVIRAFREAYPCKKDTSSNISINNRTATNQNLTVTMDKILRFYFK